MEMVFLVILRDYGKIDWTSGTEIRKDPLIITRIL
jgi:hypothetical protein